MSNIEQINRKLYLYTENHYLYTENHCSDGYARIDSDGLFELDDKVSIDDLKNIMAIIAEFDESVSEEELNTPHKLFGILKDSGLSDDQSYAISSEAYQPIFKTIGILNEKLDKLIESDKLRPTGKWRLTDGGLIE
jgi:hypothetical protein